jgi:hypothetical protein
MNVRFYFDEQVPRAIKKGLRQRGVDVLTAQEDGRTSEDDSMLLDRAGDLLRLIFTMDDDFLLITANRLRKSQHFIGVVYAHQGAASYRRFIDDLETIAIASTLEEYADRVEYLPF